MPTTSIFSGVTTSNEDDDDDDDDDDSFPKKAGAELLGPTILALLEDLDGTVNATEQERLHATTSVTSKRDHFRSTIVDCYLLFNEGCGCCSQDCIKQHQARYQAASSKEVMCARSRAAQIHGNTSDSSGFLPTILARTVREPLT
eukprot:scaffold175720_cov40-Attheya_sp.AAC.2